MEVSARVVLNKLKLVDPANIPTFSAYQQSAEIRQLWTSIESSITSILNIVSKKLSTNSVDASSQIISLLSASTLLSSIIHAIISTQRRLQKSDENIENVIKKEIKVILYHIQILRQHLNQANVEAETAQDAIIHHADILIDSLVAYSLSPSNTQFQLVHPYKVSPSTSFTRRHSQPEYVIRKQTTNENMTKETLLSHHQYGSSSSLFSDNSSSSCSSSKKKTDTVGKRFMRSINSLKSRPAFQMTLLPSRQITEPTWADQQQSPQQQRQPQKKKRLFYDHRVTATTTNSETRDDLDDSDHNSKSCDENYTSESNDEIQNSTTKAHQTLRFIFNGRRHSQATAITSSKKTHGTVAAPGGREFSRHQASNTSVVPYPKSKRESLSNLFGANRNNKQLITKVDEDSIQEPFYSSSSSNNSLSKFTTDTMKDQSATTATTVQSKLVPSRSFLISPFSRKTDIEWSLEEDNENSSTEEEDDNNSLVNNFKAYSMTNNAEDDSYSTLKREGSRKRRSNSTLVAPSLPPKVLYSIPMTRTNSPLPPLPTVENFLTIMNAPTSPDSSYFSARSTSSSSSSTLSSMTLDDVTDSLAKTQIESTTPPEQFTAAESCTTPPIPPPKDHISVSKNTDKHQLKDLEDHSITNMNNKQEKRRSSTCSSGSLKRNSSTEMRISTSDISNHRRTSSPPKSADVYLPKSRPPIPPRTSSMPLQPPKFNSSSTNVPPMPADSLERTANYKRRASEKTLTDENAWNILSESRRKSDFTKRTKLGRSLGAPSPTLKKIKKSDSGKLLKVTENGNVVLLFVMMDGKLQAIAGTAEKIFEKLADETAQDEEYIDTYLMNHAQFVPSIDLMNSLINRFHLEPSPGEYEYFLKWQYSIQSKVLHVVNRWITLYYYRDFKFNAETLKRLKLFLYNDSLLLAPQFKEQLETIRSTLKSQTEQFSDHQHHLSLISATTTTTTKSLVNQNAIALTSNFNFNLPFVNNNYAPPFPPVHFSNSSRRPSNGLFSLTSPPASPVYTPTSIYTSLSSLDSKDIARYLTLADFYLLKSIQAHGSLYSSNQCKSDNSSEFDYVELMTKRANMLSHWVVHEICSITYLKPKRSMLKKFIEIAKFCLELNNFHTCMVITMGLSSAPKLKEVRESLSNRDSHTFSSLQKLLNVSMNMRYYRQKIQLVKSPAIPFLPVLLKDQTFFNENSTYSISHPNLINFSKFRSIYQFIERNKSLTSENYHFAQDLTHFPFFSSVTPTTKTDDCYSKKVYHGQLDSIGIWIENRLGKVQHCYLQCNLLCSL